MSWIAGLFRNVAELRADDRDPALRPLFLPLAPAEALRWAAQVIATCPRWSVEGADPAAGTLHATHATRVWRLVDDVFLRFEASNAGTLMTGRSQSRIGRGDLGQNARNLKQLTSLLSQARPMP